MSAAPSTFTQRSTAYDGQKAAWQERGICTVTPAATGTITANQELECPIDQSLSTNVGDQLFVNGNNIKAGEVLKGARVTAQGVAKVIIANVTGSNITDSNAQTLDYILFHYSN